MTQLTRMQGWEAQDLVKDTSWVYRPTSNVYEPLAASASRLVAAGKQLFDVNVTDFDYGPGLLALMKDVKTELRERSGLALLKQVPLDQMDNAQTEMFYWGLGLLLGVPMPQGKNSQFISNVRNDGGAYRSTQGRGYNTNSQLDFHSDGSDIVGLLCLRQAPVGGDSMVSSSVRALQLMRECVPHLYEELQQPFTFSRQGEQAADETLHYQASIAGLINGQHFCRHIRNHINSAQLSFPDVPRLSTYQIEAMDYLDNLLKSPELMYEMRLERGDIQLLNNHFVLHSRTEFQDHEDPQLKRHMMRLWLSMYDGHVLPALWKEAYKNLEPGTLRGGFKGIALNDTHQRFMQRNMNNERLLETV
jgi:alpha-ketoglutarate-dependent taurine dioxygenase